MSCALVTFSHELNSWCTATTIGVWEPCSPGFARDAVDCGWTLLDAI